MGLQFLQQVVHRQGCVAVVEAHHHSDRDHVVTHRIDERATELPEPGRRPQGPPHGVDDPAQRRRDPPHLLDAQLPNLRMVGTEPEMVECHAGEVALGSLGEHGHLGDDVRARLEVPQLFAPGPPALVARADADDAAVRDEQCSSRRLGQHHRPRLLRLLGEPPAELGQREDQVAVVAHRWRRGDRQRPSAGEHVHRLRRDRTVSGNVLDPHPVAEEPPKRPGVDDHPREKMRARMSALLGHRQRHITEELGGLRVLLEELPEPDRAGEPGRAGADHEHADFDPLVDGIARFCDELARPKRRWIVDGSYHQGPERRRRRSTNCGTMVCTSPTTARSQNSKIGARGSLLSAMIVSELCMPTLCWTAPDTPRAT